MCEDDRDGGNGFGDVARVLHLVEYIKLPSPRKHSLSHLTLFHDLWQSVVILLLPLIVVKWCVGLLFIITLILNLLVGKDLLQDKEAENGIKCVNHGQGVEKVALLNGGESAHREGHPNLVALSKENNCLVGSKSWKKALIK